VSETATNTAVPALTVVRVSKTFPGQKALDDVSLQVLPGEVHALLGENGSGKSTLIKILAGIHLPDPGGEVLVRHEPLPLGSPSGSFELGLRFVHQKLGVIQEMNAVENIALEAGYTRGAFIDWPAQAEFTRRLLARLNITMDVWRPLRECKPVERSAVAIARALRTHDPAAQIQSADVPLIVLDEPTSSLPAPEVRQLFAVIRDLTANGVAVIYVSHRLDEVFEIADRVSVLRDGRLRATAEVQGMSRAQLIEMIVGREMARSWKRPVRARRHEQGPPVLEVVDLVAERINGLSFSVARGEILGILGVAGSGRELVARTITGAILPESGQVIVAGDQVPVVTPGETLGRGLVLAPGNTQPYSAVSNFSVRENLTLAALSRYSTLGRLMRLKERQEANEWIRRLDIRPSDPHRLYRLLSGGNQQKVIIGKWLNAEPKVLVLDEPTVGVDIGARQAIYQLISEQADRGLAVVLCSSDLEDIVSLCDRALVLRQGRVVAELAGDEITEHRLLLESVGDDVADSTQPIA
jgi:ribose transport system ATP-binding protein